MLHHVTLDSKDKNCLSLHFLSPIFYPQLCIKSVMLLLENPVSDTLTQEKSSKTIRGGVNYTWVICTIVMKSPESSCITCL